MECPYCKEVIQDGALKCKHCGSMLTTSGAIQISGSDKSRIAAGVLALLLGGLGIHKFYLGAWGWGIVYIVLVWTWIPAIVAIIEAIRYFTLSDDEFNQKVAALNNEPFAFLW